MGGITESSSSFPLPPNPRILCRLLYFIMSSSEVKDSRYVRNWPGSPIINAAWEVVSSLQMNSTGPFPLGSVNAGGKEKTRKELCRKVSDRRVVMTHSGIRQHVRYALLPATCLDMDEYPLQSKVAGVGTALTLGVRYQISLGIHYFSCRYFQVALTYLY